MEIKVTHIFIDWEKTAVEKKIVLGEWGQVIDKNNNWYNNVKYRWKVSKVLLLENFKPEPRKYDASDLSPIAYMQNKKQWANSILLWLTWWITEAIVEVLEVAK